MEITKETEGILSGFSKEVDAPEAIEKSIRKGLREALSPLTLHILKQAVRD
jgi:hexokinase